MLCILKFSRQIEKRSRIKVGENATIQKENGPLAIGNREIVYTSQFDDRCTKKKKKIVQPILE